VVTASAVRYPHLKKFRCIALAAVHVALRALGERGGRCVFRDAAIFPHMDGTTDISRFKIVKAMFPDTAGKYAGPEA
jgi:hypothetical protein